MQARQETASNKALSVLENLTEYSRLGDIASACGMNKSTAHRILHDMVERGFACRDGQGGYLVGNKLFQLVGQFLSHHDMAAYARPVLTELQRETGWTVHLAVLTGDVAVYVAKVEATKPYHLASQVGQPLPLHTSAIGKALLASMPAQEVETILRQSGMPEVTASIVTGARRLHDELDEIRIRGFAADHAEEDELGIVAVGAPVFNYLGMPVAALSVATLCCDAQPDVMTAYGHSVCAAARKLSAGLGATERASELARMVSA